MGPRAAGLSLRTGSSAAAQARGFTGRCLEAWGLTAVCPVALLLVSEIVTNAVEHSREPVRLELSRTGSGVRASVWDAEPRLPPVPRRPKVDAEAGRGLYLLDRLASRWGYDPVAGGKTVWFELDG